MKLFKLSRSVLLMSVLVFGTSNLAYAKTNEKTDKLSQNEQLTNAFATVNTYSGNSNDSFDMTMSEFTKGYSEGDYASINDYVNSYVEVLEPDANYSVSSSSGGSELWQYNTGTTLPHAANYSKYNLINVVRKGDIIYEAKGGFGITGHTAIVEGIYYSSTYNQYYIRVIEAINDGVVRSVLDDDRMDVKDSSIYRVSGASNSVINAAVSFAVSQLGDSYSLDFQKDYDNQSDWYCSELNWACYKRQGIDIETTGLLNEPGVTPRDITTRSTKTISISFS